MVRSLAIVMFIFLAQLIASVFVYLYLAMRYGEVLAVMLMILNLLELAGYFVFYRLVALL